MEEKFIVTVYKKIKLNENTFLFKKEGILTDAHIDLVDDLELLNYTNEYDEQKQLECMENEYVVVSDNEYCYGYPMTIDDLKDLYPKLNYEELIEKYKEEISSSINLAYFDIQNDRVKLFVLNDKSFEEKEPDELFSDFSVLFDSNFNNKIAIVEDDIKRAIDLIDKKQYKKLKEQLKELNKTIEEDTERAKTYFGESIKNMETEVEEEAEPQKDISNSENIEKTLTRLYNLVGLDNIKEEIEKLLSFLSFRNKSEKYLNLEKPYLHMFFTGNPGTGKTTVARIISELLYELGYVKNKKIAEITPKDLIAEYVGQTGPKTAKVIKENKGGVIFIDEAYAFSSKAQDFAEEALIEILKELEKNETVFIFAGYKDEMKRFMEMNPGLTSRVGYYMEFNDYTEEELYQIFENKVASMGFVVEDSLKEIIKANLRSAKNNNHFGNGRYIDKLINKIILKHSINTEKYKRKDKLITLTDKDFTHKEEESLLFKTKTKEMGFKIR